MLPEFKKEPLIRRIKFGLCMYSSWICMAVFAALIAYSISLSDLITSK